MQICNLKMESKTLICIVGPTAVGKTSVAIKLAGWLGCEIISADSRQFYKEMELGTAKPTLDELRTVPHHFINNLSIEENYDVGLFEKQVLEKLNDIFKTYNTALMVGGSGMFVDTVCYGLDQFPNVPEQVRLGLNQELQEKGIEALQKELKETDPEYFEIVDVQNPQRITRALEVIRFTGKKFSSFRKGERAKRPFSIIKIGLEMERSVLYERIDNRMDLMIDTGLFEEAESLIDYRNHNALQTVGYKEIFPFLDGDYNKEEAIRLLKRNSRRYAKRQLTWFKRDSEIQWFSPDQEDQIKTFIRNQLEFFVTKD